MGANIKFSADGKKARRTGKGTGYKTSIAMPVAAGNVSIDSVQIQSRRAKEQAQGDFKIASAGTVEHFVPIKDGNVGIYVCGATVQGSPHIGHLRSAVVYDQLRRWLEVIGYQVTLVRNVTDIDDKILDKAREMTEHWKSLANRFENEFNDAYTALGIAKPTYEPRATETIPEILDMIQRLIDSGYAYRAVDGSANVYFSAAKWAEYGELTNQRIVDMETSEGADYRGKLEPQDFVLWKAHKEGEQDDAAWDSPFGRGRPGWHIECSAMSSKHLGSHFDIHGGGLDLRFPHHENELAQSRAAGDKFANHWVHNGLVNVDGQKMSKSLGNSILANDLLDTNEGVAVRYYLSSAHYRSELDYHDGVLEESKAALSRIKNFMNRSNNGLIGKDLDTELPTDILSVLPSKFTDAMNNDFAIPTAISVIHETVRSGNTSLDNGDLVSVSKALVAVKAMTEVLGINPIGQNKNETPESFVADLLAERAKAREAGDFKRSDEIREQLTKAGITIQDAPTTR